MHFTVLSVADIEQRLQASVSELAEGHPEWSAINVLTPRQRNGFLITIAIVVVGCFVSLVGTGIALMAAAATFYAAGITNRIVLFWRSSDGQNIEAVTDEDALAVADDQLPTYTVLVPAYHEPELIATLLANLARLDYPRDRLQLMILLEADDQETIDAIVMAEVDDPVEVVLIPVLEPRTKPKALNFGLSLSRSDLVTIYDVEDQPEPLQLRRAAVALSRLSDDVACVQAKLSYDNVHQNLITKWFTLEYAMWFSLLLPGLVASGAPLPLGGTSNHFRRSALDAVGAWDPYNVTEDADLGIRLYRHHYRVKILDSVTLEEANSDFVNWVKQRSRWYKGYLQTFLIHLRQPRRFRDDVGARGFIQFVMFVGATPILALINPIFWTMTLIWFIGQPHFIKAIFPAPIFYVSILCWSLGNFAITYLTLLTARSERRYDLLIAALLVPIYWVMMSVAAIKAVVQLIVTPSFWEKTAHGLKATRAPTDISAERPRPSIFDTPAATSTPPAGGHAGSPHGTVGTVGTVVASADLLMAPVEPSGCRTAVRDPAATHVTDSSAIGPSDSSPVSDSGVTPEPTPVPRPPMPRAQPDGPPSLGAAASIRELSSALLAESNSGGLSVDPPTIQGNNDGPAIVAMPEPDEV